MKLKLFSIGLVALCLASGCFRSESNFFDGDNDIGFPGDDGGEPGQPGDPTPTGCLAVEAANKCLTVELIGPNAQTFTDGSAAFYIADPSGGMGAVECSWQVLARSDADIDPRSGFGISFGFVFEDSGDFAYDIHTRATCTDACNREGLNNCPEAIGLASFHVKQFIPPPPAVP